MMIHARSRRILEISDGFAPVRAGLASAVVGSALTSTSCHESPERQSVGARRTGVNRPHCLTKLDAWSRRVVGWSMATHLRRSFRSHAEARMAIFEFVEGCYNRRGAIQHWATGRRPPSRTTRGRRQHEHSGIGDPRRPTPSVGADPRPGR